MNKSKKKKICEGLEWIALSTATDPNPSTRAWLYVGEVASILQHINVLKL